MNTVDLTQTQQDALNTLVAAGRLRRVPVDLAKAGRFLAAAEECLADVKQSTLHARSRHRLCYDAAHDVVEALIAGHGYTTTSGSGQHQKLGEAAVALLDAPPEVALVAQMFDGLRQVRNGDHYTASMITPASADVAERIASTLLSAARVRLRP